MYPELWLHDLARERQREIREFAARSARRSVGEEYFASDRRPRKARKRHLYVGHPVQLLGNWARLHIVPGARARD
jgi:hypothetical protein